MKTHTQLIIKISLMMLVNWLIESFSVGKSECIFNEEKGLSLLKVLYFSQNVHHKHTHLQFRSCNVTLDFEMHFSRKVTEGSERK